MTWIPCAAHCLDLLLEDIGKLPWSKAITDGANEIANFMKNHQMALAMFRRRSSKEIIKPGRFMLGGEVWESGHGEQLAVSGWPEFLRIELITTLDYKCHLGLCASV